MEHISYWAMQMIIYETVNTKTEEWRNPIRHWKGEWLTNNHREDKVNVQVSLPECRTKS
jgi:hypothetical protein